MQTLKTKSEIHEWIKEYVALGCEYIIHDDLTVDVLNGINFRKLPIGQFPFQFGKVIGNFRSPENGLTTLKGSPYFVDGDFSVTNSFIQTLEYCPKIIKGDLHIPSNPLYTLRNDIEELGGIIKMNCTVVPEGNKYGIKKAMHVPLSFVNAIYKEIDRKKALKESYKKLKKTLPNKDSIKGMKI